MSDDIVNAIRRRFDSKGLPDYMWGGVQRWIFDAIPPGHFLSAVICNDLKDAVGRADETNRAALADWVLFFYNDAPSECWGSVAAFNHWIERGGLNASG